MKRYVLYGDYSIPITQTKNNAPQRAELDISVANVLSWSLTIAAMSLMVLNLIFN